MDRPDLDTVKRLIAWLDISLSSLFVGAQPIRAHLRAPTNLASPVAAAIAKLAHAVRREYEVPSERSDSPAPVAGNSRRLTGSRRERLAVRFRETVSSPPDSPLDPFSLRVKGAQVQSVDKLDCLDPSTIYALTVVHAKLWSAATIPLNDEESEWLIALNPTHTAERKRATLMEEICHILLGHTLTTLSHMEGQTFRDYNREQELDAYGLGAAILVPKEPLVARVRAGTPAEQIAKHFEVSTQLIEYRIKVTGAWYEYKLKQHVTAN